MLDIKAQSQLARAPLAQATADVIRACALATARAASVSALQGMSLWTGMLRSSAEHLDRSAGTTPSSSPAEDASAQAHATARATEPAFASYRSSGGHAVAQIVIA